VTNAPASRQTHVIRILGTNKNGDVLPDIWVDVERIDEARSVDQGDSPNNWQGIVRRFRWGDDPDSEDGVVEPRTRDGVPVGTGSRDVIVVKVCSPDELDITNPQEWVSIDSIKIMRMMDSDQGVVQRHINDELTDARIVERRRVSHYDTSIDVDAQVAFDADPTRTVFVVPGDQYTRDDSTKDDSQYVETEVITYLKERSTHDTQTGAQDDQGQQIKLLNQYLIDESDDAVLDVIGPDGFNPPWRLDPYQNIVNVQLRSPGNMILAYVYADTDGAFPDQLVYLYLTGSNAGSEAETDVFDGVHVPDPAHFTAHSSSASFTAAQNDAIALLSFGSSTDIDRTLGFACDSSLTLYAFEADGTTKWFIDLNDWFGGVTIPFASTELGWDLVDLRAFGNSVYVTFRLTFFFPGIESDSTAVAWAAFDSNGNNSDFQIITGPTIFDLSGDYTKSIPEIFFYGTIKTP